MQAELASLAADSQINGKVVDVSQQGRVAAANAQADSKESCHYAKNLVADAVKEVIDAYRANNPLAYVIFVGSDNDIPFYRVPDTTDLGQEENYFVPVISGSSSDAVQRKNFYLSHDPYVSDLVITKGDDPVFVPALSAGRLAETPQNIINLIDAYFATPVIAPVNAAVTAYDFLSDGGEDVFDVLNAAAPLAVNDDLLIRESDVNPALWTATIWPT